jgi:Tfp pilus assembly protein PilF
MELQLQTKAQAFVLLDAFETDLRACFVAFVADHLEYSIVLGDNYGDVLARATEDDHGDAADLVQYLYLRQVYDLLLRYKGEIPRDLGDELSTNVASLPHLVSVRNRVMHGRPLEIDDLESISGLLSRFASRHFQLSRLTRDHLASDPLWDPPFTPKPVRYERVLHNLPLADFDETGLVGRGTEIQAIKQLVEGRRDRIVTVTGEGGIGKTALALQIAYSIVDDPKSPFDCVLWVSLKNEILTADGVRALTGAIQDMAGASLVMGQVLDSTFSGSILELAESLEGLSALVVIDNLETAQGTEVLELYDALPFTTSFLFTSRVGLGQVERRYPLGGLDPKSATLLFRKFATRRRVTDLASSPQTAVDVTLASLRFSPLAIRWYVLSVEAGGTPSDTVRNQSELLRFCVDNVYEALEPNAKLLLVILRSLDRPISFDELAVIAELPVDELRASSQALSRGSLVVRQPPTEDEGEKLQISATARAYLPRVDYASPMLRGVAAREAAYLSDRERQLLEGQARRLDANTVHIRNPDDQPTAHLLRLALRFGRSEDFAKADLQIERARSLNPEFFEVDRVAAFNFANQRDLYRAGLTYRSALSLAQKAEEKAVVAYFFAGFLARQQHDLEAATRYAEQAHATLNYHDTALLLGNVYVWSHRFAEGQEQLEFALDAPSSKMKRIVTTSVVESWRRWADASIESRNPSDGFDKALSGVAVGRQIISTGVQDQKLASSVLSSMQQALKAIERISDVGALDQGRLANELRFIAEWVSLFRIVSGWSRFYEQLLRVGQMFPMNSPVAEVLTVLVRADRSRVESDSFASTSTNTALVLRGAIKTLRDNYGFIDHSKYPQGIFFHSDSLAPGVTKASLFVGQQMEFQLQLQSDGRYRGVDVAPLT